MVFQVAAEYDTVFLRHRWYFDNGECVRIHNDVPMLDSPAVRFRSSEDEVELRNPCALQPSISVRKSPMSVRFQTARSPRMSRRQLALDVMQIEHQNIAIRPNRLGIRRAPEMLNHRDPIASIKSKLTLKSCESIDQRRHSAYQPPSIPPHPRGEMSRVTRQNEAFHLDIVFGPQVFEQRCRSQPSSASACSRHLRREKQRPVSLAILRIIELRRCRPL